MAETQTPAENFARGSHGQNSDPRSVCPNTENQIQNSAPVVNNYHHCTVTIYQGTNNTSSSSIPEPTVARNTVQTENTCEERNIQNPVENAKNNTSRTQQIPQRPQCTEQTHVQPSPVVNISPARPIPRRPVCTVRNPYLKPINSSKPLQQQMTSQQHLRTSYNNASTSSTSQTSGNNSTTTNQNLHAKKICQKNSPAVYNPYRHQYEANIRNQNCQNNSGRMTYADKTKQNLQPRPNMIRTPIQHRQQNKMQYKNLVGTQRQHIRPVPNQTSPNPSRVTPTTKYTGRRLHINTSVATKHPLNVPIKTSGNRNSPTKYKLNTAQHSPRASYNRISPKNNRARPQSTTPTTRFVTPTSQLTQERPTYLYDLSQRSSSSGESEASTESGKFNKILGRLHIPQRYDPKRNQAARNDYKQAIYDRYGCRLDAPPEEPKLV